MHLIARKKKNHSSSYLKSDFTLLFEPTRKKKKEKKVVLTSSDHILVSQYPRCRTHLPPWIILFKARSRGVQLSLGDRHVGSARARPQIYKFDRQTLRVRNSRNMVLQSHSSQRNLPSTEPGPRPHIAANTSKSVHVCVCNMLLVPSVLGRIQFWHPAAPKYVRSLQIYQRRSFSQQVVLLTLTPAVVPSICPSVWWGYSNIPN